MNTISRLLKDAGAQSSTSLPTIPWHQNIISDTPNNLAISTALTPFSEHASMAGVFGSVARDTMSPPKNLDN